MATGGDDDSRQVEHHMGRDREKDKDKDNCNVAPLEVPARRRLDFRIHKASSWSNNFVPE